MTIYELMSTKVDMLKKDIIESINNMLISKSIIEIEIQSFTFFPFDFETSFKYNVITRHITIMHTGPFDIMESEIQELIELLKYIENNNYEITK